MTRIMILTQGTLLKPQRIIWNTVKYIFLQWLFRHCRGDSDTSLSRIDNKKNVKQFDQEILRLFVFTQASDKYFGRAFFHRGRSYTDLYGFIALKVSLHARQELCDFWVGRTFKFDFWGEATLVTFTEHSQNFEKEKNISKK